MPLPRLPSLWGLDRGEKMDGHREGLAPLPDRETGTVSLTPVRMPDYKPMGARRFKPLRDVADTSPRVSRILGIPAEDLMQALAVACINGCAVLFSPTSDGGAISVTVYLGDDRLRDYAASAEEFAAALVAVRDSCEAHGIRGTGKGLKVAPGASQSK